MFVSRRLPLRCGPLCPKTYLNLIFDQCLCYVGGSRRVKPRLKASKLQWCAFVKEALAPWSAHGPSKTGTKGVLMAAVVLAGLAISSVGSRLFRAA